MVREVRGLGLMWAIEFAEPDTLSRSYRLVERLQNGLFAQLVVAPLFRDQRVLIQVAGHGIPVIKGIPPLVVSEEDVSLLRRLARRGDRQGDQAASRHGRIRADRRRHTLTEGTVLLKLGAAILAVVAGVGAIAIAIALLSSAPGPAGSSQAGTVITVPTTPTAIEGGRIPTPNSPGFPSPPPGALVLAREAGTSALGLAIVPGAAQSLVRVSVLGGDGSPAAHLDVSLAAGGTTTKLPACAAGCYQSEVATSTLAGRVTVALGASTYDFALPASLRLPDGAATVAHAGVVWRGLKTLAWHERLAASPTEALNTVYTAVAPDQLAYTISNRSSAIIIGLRRWDRPTPTAPWTESVQNPPVRQPVPFWAGVTDARVIGSGVVGGRPVWEITFFDPVTPAWFEAKIDKQNGHTLRLEMTAVAHFMRHVYGPFNAPYRLHPPAA